MLENQPQSISRRGVIGLSVALIVVVALVAISGTDSSPGSASIAAPSNLNTYLDAQSKLEVSVAAVKMENMVPTDKAVALYTAGFKPGLNKLLTIFEFDRVPQSPTVDRIHFSDMTCLASTISVNVEKHKIKHTRNHVMTVCGHKAQLLSVANVSTSLDDSEALCPAALLPQQVCKENKKSSPKTVMRVPVRLKVGDDVIMVVANGIGLAPHDYRFDPQVDCVEQEMNVTLEKGLECADGVVGFIAGDINTRIVANSQITVNADKRLTPDSIRYLAERLTTQAGRRELLAFDAMTYHGPTHSGASYEPRPARKKLAKSFRFMTEWWRDNIDEEVSATTYKRTPYSTLCSENASLVPISTGGGFAYSARECMDKAIVVGNHRAYADKESKPCALRYPIEKGTSRGSCDATCCESTSYFGMDEDGEVNIQAKVKEGMYVQGGWLDAVGIARGPGWMPAEFEEFQAQSSFYAYDHLLVTAKVVVPLA